MDGLKPCPFCGGEAVIAHEMSGITQVNYSYVKCKDLLCGVHGRKFPVSYRYTSDEKAVKFWNNRNGEI